MTKHPIVPVDRIERAILVLRGHKVIMDKDLAALYGVTTGNLNKAVSRNIERFPGDFMFQLSADELKNLMFRFGTSSWGGTRKLPRAFTGQGVAMLSSVRAFVRLRQMLQQNADLAHKLAALEKKYDAQFKVVFDAIRELMVPPETKRRRIGFSVKEGRARYAASVAKRAEINLKELGYGK